VNAPLAWGLVVIVPLVLIEMLALFHLLARRPDLGLASKAGWAAGIVLIPFIGSLAYVLLRSPGAASGKAIGEQATGSTMQQLRDLMASHDSGSVDDNQYTAAKEKLFGVGSPESSGLRTEG